VAAPLNLVAVVLFIVGYRAPSLERLRRVERSALALLHVTSRLGAARQLAGLEKAAARPRSLSRTRWKAPRSLARIKGFRPLSSRPSYGSLETAAGEGAGARKRAADAVVAAKVEGATV
jgi:hypothetical protein